MKLVKSSLQMTLTKETKDGAFLTWVPSIPGSTFSSCSLHYGPLTEAVHVTTKIDPDRGHVTLANLTPYTPYYAYLTCYQGADMYPTNTVHFTPRQYLLL